MIGTIFLGACSLGGAMIISDSINNQNNSSPIDNSSPIVANASEEDNLIHILYRYKAEKSIEELQNGVDSFHYEYLLNRYKYDFSKLRLKKVFYFSLSKTCYYSLPKTFYYDGYSITEDVTEDVTEKPYAFFCDIAKKNNLLHKEEESGDHKIGARRLFEIGIELMQLNGFVIKEISFEPFYSCLMECKDI